MSRLVVFGSVNADHVIQVPHFPKPGETLTGANYQQIPGGKGANQALAAARLGVDVSFIASVGDDDFGRSFLADFKREGIDVTQVLVQHNMPTGIAMIQVSDVGENSIALSAEANAELTASHITQAMTQHIAQADYLLLQLETPISGIEHAIKLAKANQTHVVLNPAPAQVLNDETLSLIDMITPNETEAQILTGIQVVDELSADKAAQTLHHKGIETVLITLGAKGVYYSDQTDSARIIQGFKVKACDTTAAGDTFNGALVAGLAQGMAMDDAIEFAHAAAAISVTRFGAQTSIPYHEDVEQFLQANK
ncbi:MAG: ribokinase [Vibrio sp.]